MAARHGGTPQIGGAVELNGSREGDHKGGVDGCTAQIGGAVEIIGLSRNGLWHGSDWGCCGTSVELIGSLDLEPEERPWAGLTQRGSCR